MKRAVLDTNVLVSALLSPFGNEARILDAVQRKQLLPCLSAATLEEYAEVLSRPKFGFDSEEIRGLIDMLCANGVVVEPPPIRSISPDPDDDIFIACAFASSAEYIVTGNKRHYPPDTCNPVQVVNAREFLEEQI